MPLIVISGRPCTGKTTIATALAKYLSEYCVSEGGAAPTVVVLNDETLGIHKTGGYENATTEKVSRAALKAAVDRSCNADTVVICDALNYIKGYRYELFCIIRSVASTHCCVFVDAPEDCARDWNRARVAAGGAAAGYSDAEFDDLWSRFETPDEKNRWDSPLFMLNDDDVAGVLESVVSIRVSSGAGSLSSDATAPLSAHGAGLDSLTLDDTSKHPDSTTSTGTDATVTASGTTAAAATTAARAYESPTFEAIAASLFKRASLRPPAAVILTKTAAPNFLHELDRRTAETLSFIVTAMSSAVVGDTIKIPGSSVGLQLARKVTPMELRRLKRQFDKTAAASPTDIASISKRFVEYLNGILKGEGA